MIFGMKNIQPQENFTSANVSQRKINEDAKSVDNFVYNSFCIKYLDVLCCALFVLNQAEQLGANFRHTVQNIYSTCNDSSE